MEKKQLQRMPGQRGNSSVVSSAPNRAQRFPSGSGPGGKRKGPGHHHGQHKGQAASKKAKTEKGRDRSQSAAGSAA